MKIFIALFLLNTFIFASDSNERFRAFRVGHFFKKEAPFIDVVYDKVTKSWFYYLPTERQEIINRINNPQIDLFLKIKHSSTVKNFPFSKYNPFYALIVPKLIDDKDENNIAIGKSIILIKDYSSNVLFYINDWESHCGDWIKFEAKLDKFVKEKREYKFIKTENPTDLKNLLPRELLNYIIYLMKNDAFVFYLVSKDWQQLLKNGLTKINIVDGDIYLSCVTERITKQVDLKLIRNFFPNITDFSIYSNGPKNFDALGSFTKLISLELIDIRNENYEMYKKKEKLKGLNLSGLTNLKRLKVCQVYDVEESELEKIGLLPNLEYLKVELHEEASYSLPFDIDKLKNLKKLCLENVEFNKKTWEKLASLRELNFLKISISGTWDDEDDSYSHFLDELDGIQNLSLLTKLNTFILDMEEPRLNEGASSKIDFSFLLSLTNLANLKLTTCINNQMLLKFKKAFTNLKCLNIK